MHIDLYIESFVDTPHCHIQMHTCPYTTVWFKFLTWCLCGGSDAAAEHMQICSFDSVLLIRSFLMCSSDSLLWHSAQLDLKFIC